MLITFVAFIQRFHTVDSIVTPEATAMQQSTMKLAYCSKTTQLLHEDGKCAVPLQTRWCPIK